MRCRSSVPGFGLNHTRSTPSGEGAESREPAASAMPHTSAASVRRGIIRGPCASDPLSCIAAVIAIDPRLGSIAGAVGPDRTSFKRMTRSAPRHAAALTLFIAATALWLWPFLGSGEGAIPGAGPGDNLTFVWNLWWTRFALHHAGAGVFFSSFLFFPLGADLTLHTHTLGPALLT